MHRVSPEVFLVARPAVDASGITAYLKAVGGEAWRPTPGMRDGDLLAEFMGRLCYRSWAPGLNANVTKVRTDSEDYLGNILQSKHGSVLEHANYSLVFKDVSRVFTHELVRHRAGCAYSQESLRFVRLTDLGLWMPPDSPQWMVDLFERTFKDLEAIQLRMANELELDDPTKKFAEKKQFTSLMRRIAPEGLATTIGMTANVRAIRHMISMRTSPGAEAEIRVAFRQVAKIMLAEAPMLFQDMELTEDSYRFKNDKV